MASEESMSSSARECGPGFGEVAAVQGRPFIQIRAPSLTVYSTGRGIDGVWTGFDRKVVAGNCESAERCRGVFGRCRKEKALKRCGASSPIASGAVEGNRDRGAKSRRTPIGAGQNHDAGGE